jgi:hypothetical protein|tara:strand:- start:245 stop:505 length:261 start_codon:yes stop_codon:yes gene_type:complete
MKQTKPRKVGSGRKKGSYSFTRITLADLNERFKETAEIVVSRKWAEGNGLQGKVFVASVQAMEATTSKPVEQPEDNAPVDMELTSW